MDSIVSVVLYFHYFLFMALILVPLHWNYEALLFYSLSTPDNIAHMLKIFRPNII